MAIFFGAGNGVQFRSCYFKGRNEHDIFCLVDLRCDWIQSAIRDREYPYSLGYAVPWAMQVRARACIVKHSFSMTKESPNEDCIVVFLAE